VMKYGGIIGPYVPSYPEVTDKLAGVKSGLARWVYHVMLTKFPIDEDWSDDPVWVSGIISATKKRIADQSAVSYPAFYRYWKQLIEAGLVREREGGLFVLPFFKKKAYDAISPTEVRERFSRNEAVIAENEAVIAKLKAAIENDPENPGKQEDDYQQIITDHQQNVEDHQQNVDVSYPFKGLKKEKISLSREKIISWFYKQIGQSRISGVEREKARQVYRKLKADQFTVREIDFAVRWTIENATEKPRSFSLVNSMIGQAMEALKNAEEKAKRVEEEKRLVDEARIEQEKQAEDTKRIEAIKDGMTPRKRENLRDEAFRELTDIQGMSKAFIGEPLIKSKENEIIRRSLEEKQQ